MPRYNPAVLEDEDDVIDVAEQDGGLGFGLDDGDDDHRAVDQGDDDDNADEEPRQSSRRHDDEDGDDEDADLGKRARKRIAQMRRKQGDAERRAIEAERKLRETEERIASLEGRYAQVTTASLDREIEGKRGALKEAIENGDTDAQLMLQEELTDLRLRKQSMGQRREVFDERGQDAAQPRQRMPQSKDEIYATMTPRGEQWARQINLLDQPQHLIGIAVATEAQIAHSGISRDTDEYFEALDAELRRRAPELYEGLDDGGLDVPAEKPRRRVQSPVAPPARSSSGADAPARKGGRIRLTAEQVKNMKMFGLDPTNPEHVRSYAENAR